MTFIKNVWTNMAKRKKGISCSFQNLLNLGFWQFFVIGFTRHRRLLLGHPRILYRWSSNGQVINTMVFGSSIPRIRARVSHQFSTLIRFSARKIEDVIKFNTSWHTWYNCRLKLISNYGSNFPKLRIHEIFFFFLQNTAI